MICSNLEVIAQKRYACTSGKCGESTTGQYTEPSCGGTCTPAPQQSGSSLLIPLAVAAGLAYILLSGKNKKGRK